MVQKWARPIKNGVKGTRNGEETVLVNWWDGQGGMIDFTNPECSDWFKNHLYERMENYGIDGFKFDAGEVNYLLNEFQTFDNDAVFLGGKIFYKRGI